MNTNAQQRRKERIDRGIKIRTDGLYALMSWREMAYLIAPRFILIAGLLMLPQVMPGMYWVRVISIVCIYAILAISFDFQAHYIGLVSLGGAFFVGTGGYLTAILNTSLGMNPLMAIVCATLLGGMFCTLLLLPCLPLRGVYFAIVTLMYPLFLARVIEALDILGGTDGILGIDSFPNAFVEQYWVIVVLLLFLFGIRRLANTDLGLVFRAVKDNDQAVRASGINITHYKALAVFIASSTGCMAGAVWCTSTCGPAYPRLPWTFPCFPLRQPSSAAAGPWWALSSDASSWYRYRSCYGISAPCALFSIH